MLDTCPPLKHLLLAIPEYDGTMKAQCVQGIVGGIMDCLTRGILIETRQGANCCYLDLVRNDLVRQFMESEADRLLFIDADIGFPGEAVYRIASTSHPVVAGVYPKKADPLAWPVAHVWQAPNEEGLIEASGAPTGFMCIHRQVFEAMQPHVPTFIDDRGVSMPAYFQTEIYAGKYFGEDFNFCRRWTELGGKVWIDPDIDFTHVGAYAWDGNYQKWLSNREQWEHIEGFNHCPTIYRDAVSQAGNGAHFVEVGAWKGRSAAFMAECIRESGKRIKFDVVDHFEGSPELVDDADMQAGTLRQAFDRNTAYVKDWIPTVHQCQSIVAALVYSDDSLDFVFLDAAHDPESVEADCAAWWPKVRPGGVLAGDDWGWESVRLGVTAYFEQLPDDHTLECIDAGWRIVKPRREVNGTVTYHWL